MMATIVDWNSPITYVEALFLMMGIGVFGAGWFAGRRTGPRGLARLRATFVQWGLPTGYLGDEDAMVAEYAAKVGAVLRGQYRWFGAGMIAVVVADHALALIFTGGTLFLTAFGGYLYFVSIIVAALGAGAVGVARAIRRLRPAAGHATFGELRPRRLADFCPRWYVWLLAGQIGVVILVTTFAAFALGPRLTLALLDGSVVTLPANPLTVGLIPLLMVLILAGAQLASLWVVSLPRLAVVSDLVVAPRADDILRARLILAFQQQPSILQMFLTTAQMTLLLRSLPHDAGGVVGLILLGSAIAIFVGIIGLLGRVTAPPPAFVAHRRTP